MKKLDHMDCGTAAEKLAGRIRSRLLNSKPPIKLYGVPRGGIPAAYLVAHFLHKVCGEVLLVNEPHHADVIIDDLIDSGETRKRYREQLFGSLFHKGGEDFQQTGNTLWGENAKHDEWLVFPWEGSEKGSADDIVIRLLQFIGEDFTREGLRETPARVIKAWREEWGRGYRQDPKDVLKVFEDGGEKYDEMILVRDIPIYTHCEHHLAPFFGVAHIGYVPNGKVVGLSKLARLADIFARRLQVQERLTAQIADALMEGLQPKGVAVVLQCRHLCMESRGISKQGSITTTSKLLGVMMNTPAARSEFFALINGGRHA